MASGIKGHAKPGGGNPNFATTPLFTATTTTTLILAACNQSSAAETIRVAVIPGNVSTGTESPTPVSDPITTSMYLEFDFSLGANTSFERTGITMESGARLMVGSSNGGVSFVAYGLES